MPTTTAASFPMSAASLHCAPPSSFPDAGRLPPPRAAVLLPRRRSPPSTTRRPPPSSVLAASLHYAPLVLPRCRSPPSTMRRPPPSPASAVCLHHAPPSSFPCAGHLPPSCRSTPSRHSSFILLRDLVRRPLAVGDASPPPLRLHPDGATMLRVQEVHRRHLRPFNVDVLDAPSSNAMASASTANNGACRGSHRVEDI
ncbi:hypothetical protein VPH35_077494 [Triticum aestivum]